MELFIAIGIEQTVAKRLCTYMGKQLMGIPIENPEDFHITLRYIGHTEKVNEIAEQLSSAVYPDFSLRLEGFHSFVHKRPRQSVIWQGLDDPNGHLPALRAEIDMVLDGIFQIKDEEPFTPHITLAYTDERDPQLEQLERLFLPNEVEFRVTSFGLWCVLPEQTPVRFRKIASYQLSREKDRSTVRLLCINDFHASLCESSASLGAGKLVQAVNDYKNENGNTIVFWGGDNFFGNPISELFSGEPTLEVMRAVGTTASVAGNHEFDFPLNLFQAWPKKGGFSMLAANLVRRGADKPPEFVLPYVMIHCADIKIAVIGLAVEEPMDGPDRPSEWKVFEISDGVAAARRWIDFLKAGNDIAGIPDAIFALTHFGFRETREGELIGEEVLRLAREVPELAGVFTAHFHRFLQLTVGKVAIVQGGSTARGFAVAALTFDRKRNLLSTVPLSYDLMTNQDRLAEDTLITKRIKSYYAKAEREMGRTVIVAERDIMHRDANTNAILMTGTPLTRLATEVMMQATGCQIALLYAGRIGNGFSKGSISLYQFYQVYSFENVIVTTHLTGKQLWSNIEKGMRTLPDDGASPLAIGGLNVAIDPMRSIGERVLDIQLEDGTPLNAEQTYSVVLEDYLASDQLGFRLSDGDEMEYHTMTLRNLMLEYFEAHEKLDGKYPKNITIQKSEV